MTSIRRVTILFRLKDGMDRDPDRTRTFWRGAESDGDTGRSFWVASSCDVFGGACWLSAREMVDPMQLFSAPSFLHRPCSMAHARLLARYSDGVGSLLSTGSWPGAGICKRSAYSGSPVTMRLLLLISDLFCRKRPLTTSSPASLAGSLRAWVAKLLARFNALKLASCA